jgi:hypothetical protein
VQSNSHQPAMAICATDIAIGSEWGSLREKIRGTGEKSPMAFVGRQAAKRVCPPLRRKYLGVAPAIASRAWHPG